jgi:hypothetical protein
VGWGDLGVELWGLEYSCVVMQLGEGKL